MKKTSVLVFSLLVSLPAWARLGQAPNGANLDRAVELVNELMQPGREWVQDQKVLRELKEIDPSGKAYVDEILSSVVKTLNWCDISCTMILVHTNEVLQKHPENGSANAQLKASLRSNLYELLTKFDLGQREEDIVVKIYDRYDLWSEAELPFLQKRLFNFNKETSVRPKVAAINKVFAKGSDEFKAGFAEITRKQKENIFAYSLLFKHGLLKDSEMATLIRLFAKDLEIGGAKQLDGNELLDSVLEGLHERLKAGDAAVVAGHDRVVRTFNNWARNFDEDTQKEIQQFLADLKTGNFARCETYVDHKGK